jgi:hypothetical protein
LDIGNRKLVDAIHAVIYDIIEALTTSEKDK